MLKKKSNKNDIEKSDGTKSTTSASSKEE